MVNNINHTDSILLSTAYFPPVEYFACLVGAKEIVLEQKETFPKQTFRNRCQVMTAAGKVTLVAPVVRPGGNHSQTSEIGLCFKEPWQRNHWKTLITGYASSPFFNYYADLISQMLFQKEVNLFRFNLQIILNICDLLELSPKIKSNDRFEKNPERSADYRNLIHPKKTTTFHIIPYPQVFIHLHGFIPGLSILDLLFNLGPESRDYLVKLWNANRKVNQQLF